MTRFTRATAVLAALLALAGCTGLPTAGEVKPGRNLEENQQEVPYIYQPLGPQDGASPDQIVRGFLDAATSPLRDWETARSFLADGTAWKPTSNVHIVTSERTFQFDEGASSGVVHVHPIGVLDETGVYAGQPDSDEMPLPFELAKQPNGEWRITKAPDGIVLEADVFTQVYRPVSLSWFDATWTYLVPDQRWVPRVNAATWIMRALLAAPSPWLAGSVVSAFPDTVALTPDSVPVDLQVATVKLSGADLTQLDDMTYARMRAQIEASLRSVASQGVRIVVDGSSVSTPAAFVSETSVGTNTLVLQDGAVGYLDGEEVAMPLEPYARLLAGLDVTAAAVSVPADRAAIRTADGHVHRLADGEVTEVDVRDGLLAPSLDPRGFVWTIAGGEPTAVRAFGADGAVQEVKADAFEVASRIEAFEVSRDGARVVAVLTIGGEHVLAVLGVTRDADGTPTALGPLTEQNQLAVLPGRVSAVTWLDDVTVAAAVPGEGETTIWTQPIGGPSSTSIVAYTIVDIAGVNDPGTVRLLDVDGAVLSRRSASWVRVAENVSVLVTQQSAISQR